MNQWDDILDKAAASARQAYAEICWSCGGDCECSLCHEGKVAAGEHEGRAYTMEHPIWVEVGMPERRSLVECPECEGSNRCRHCGLDGKIPTADDKVLALLLAEGVSAMYLLRENNDFDAMNQVLDATYARLRTYQRSIELTDEGKQQAAEYLQGVLEVAKKPPRSRTQLSADSLTYEEQIELGLLVCSVCKEVQFMTPSGATCPNRHGGAPSEEPVEPASS